ncbi:ComF family protein [Candidatus Gracilibacteria bacterium]|nr:ComF family protein [Candidatus Gracilibacteria bacterium]
MNGICLRIKKAWQWFLAALFPPRCLVCKKEGDYLCPTHFHFEIASPSQASFKYLDGIHAATKYTSVPAEKCTEYFKFRGFKEIGKIMALEMIKNSPRSWEKNAVLIPVPLHWSREIWRGFNQSELLAREIAQRLHLPVCLDLKRTKKTNQQAKLGKQDRQKNLSNVFQWQGKNIPKNVILVDDVVTSGATLDSAARELKNVGVNKVLAIVFARSGK